MTNNKIGFFSTAIQNWDSLKRALVIIIFFFIFFSIFSAIVLGKLKGSGLRVELDSNTNLIFDDSKLFQRYLLHPRGWQDTELKLDINDKVVIKADGSINIGMGRIAKATIDRYALAKEYTDKDKGFEYEDFPKKVKERLTYRYPWVGPKGLDPELIDNPEIKNKVRGWGEKQLFKGTPKSPVNFGQLIAMIVPEDDLGKFQNAIPSTNISYIKYDWWPIGNSTVEHTVTKSGGNLLFIINDSISNDSLANQMLWMDNIGFLSAQIIIKKK